MDPPAGRIRREPVTEVGLTVLFEPDRPSLDIVFVHGFTGSPEKTWTHRGGTTGHHIGDRDEPPPPKVRKLHSPFQARTNEATSTPAVFWPRDLLPSTIPDARVLTYGYDTHLRHKLIGRALSKLTLYDIAKDLLVSIESRRRDEPSRPVLFVCHSLGGVVIKEMLRQASHCQAADLRIVCESTIGIMFFGTPHSGADPRELLHHIAEKLFRLAGLSVNEQIVSTLLPTSERLRLLRDEFNPIAEKQGWAIHSFQEAHGVRLLGSNRVVEDMSSYLGLGPLETTQHINADHMEMCRFSHLEDPEYLKVVAALRKMTSKTAPPSNEDARSHETPQPLTDSQREALLQSLRFSQIDTRLVSVKAAHAKTCSWFLESSEYVDWLDAQKLDNHHGFLWIKAKPGAGKSTLMKFVLTRYRKKYRNSISFFFNARGAELERTTLGMYRSLLLQLLDSRPHLRRAFDAAEFAPWNVSGDYVWSVETLKRVFEEAVHLLDPSESVASFIDALDECPEHEIRDMLQFFEDLGSYAILNGIHFRVLFSSRHYPHITISNGIDMVLEQQHEHFEDIRKYVESRLKINTKNVELRDEILTRIQEKASGVFMWVVLVVDMLNKSHDEGRPSRFIWKRLEDLPSDLSELFRDILMRDPHHTDELLLCLQWILFARRPLMPNELYCAIHAGTDSQALGRWDFDEDGVERFILNSSKGLAEVIKTKAKARPKAKDDAETERGPETDTRIVQFIHESVRDFLLKEGGLSMLWPHLGDGFEAQTHDSLKNCCLAYITTPGVHELVREPDSPTKIVAAVKDDLPFLEYATQSVLFHADGAAIGGIGQQDFLRNFPLQQWVILHNALERFQARRYSTAVTFLYVLAENNLAALVRAQASGRDQTGLEVEPERFGTPLFAALATKSKEAALAILETVAQSEQSVPRLRDLCALFSQGSISRSWDMSFRFRKGIDVFWNSLCQHDALVVSFLITLSQATQPSSFNIETPNRDGQTPLLYAADRGLESVVRVLLDAGAYIEARDDDFRTPLIRAAENGHENVVKILIEGGADIEAQDWVSRTPPLSYAAESGRKAVVKILIEGGADIEAQDYFFRTPLIRATEHGHEAVVKILIEGGADIEVRDRSGRTPLFFATHWGYEAAVKILIDSGANIEARNQYCQTPLHYAALCHSASMVQTLLTHGAQIEKRDNDGLTPLAFAVKFEEAEAVRALISRGARVDSKDNYGRTPLSLAAERGAVDQVLELVRNGAHINERDDNGRTPLSWAAGMGKTATALELIKNGANIETTDKDGRDFLAWAEVNGHYDVVELLLKQLGH